MKSLETFTIRVNSVAYAGDYLHVHASTIHDCHAEIKFYIPVKYRDSVQAGEEVLVTLLVKDEQGN